MRVALISLSEKGGQTLAPLVAGLPHTQLFVYETVEAGPDTVRFGSIVSLTGEIFNEFDGLVYAAPCGAVVRAIAGNFRDKRQDPAVVVVDVGGRYAVSLLSGHEGGANDLAITVGNILGAEPVITTTTEALKSIIVGVGCRRGIDPDRIVDAVKRAVLEVGIALEEVRYIASVDIKADEEGLLVAARVLGIPLRLIPSVDIRNSQREFGRSDFVHDRVNLPAVAEPAALLAGRRTELVSSKKAYNGVTVALARESSLWSE
jgi:cobalt-precorrin 5A hydrolase